MNESGSVCLLHMEIERLKEENERLAQSVRDTETKVILYHYVDMVKIYQEESCQLICSLWRCVGVPPTQPCKLQKATEGGHSAQGCNSATLLPEDISTETWFFRLGVRSDLTQQQQPKNSFKFEEIKTGWSVQFKTNLAESEGSLG